MWFSCYILVFTVFYVLGLLEEGFMLVSFWLTYGLVFIVVYYWVVYLFCRFDCCVFAIDYLECCYRFCFLCFWIYCELLSDFGFLVLALVCWSYDFVLYVACSLFRFYFVGIDFGVLFRFVSLTVALRFCLVILFYGLGFHWMFGLYSFFYWFLFGLRFVYWFEVWISFACGFVLICWIALLGVMCLVVLTLITWCFGFAWDLVCWLSCVIDLLF